jgi:3-isopropylmalate/(R)-2-methylmalate dehydratase small subunit
VSYKSGLLAISLRKDETRYLRERLLESLGASITIDLNRQNIVAPDGTAFAFEIDHFVKRMFVEGKNEIDLTLGLQDKIKAFEARHMATLPWVFDKHQVDQPSTSQFL